MIIVKGLRNNGASIFENNNKLLIIDNNDAVT